ncbi:MAG: HEAT repeat domain-containing protein, partial [Candidatus Omnitrophica bacterium]|nr:HEAT repeat domain-containing protein [Candidatus Omnitrophota bacterium]
LHFSSILWEIRLVPNEERGEMLDATIMPGDPVYVLGSVQRNPEAPPDAVDSEALVVKPNVERKLAGPFWRLLYGGGRTAAWRAGNENIFFLTNSSEQTAAGLIRKGMIISWISAAIWILCSLWLLQEEIPRLLWNENITAVEIMREATPDERRLLLLEMVLDKDRFINTRALNDLWSMKHEIEKLPGCCPEMVPGLLRVMKKGQKHEKDFAAFALSRMNTGWELAVPGLLALAGDLEPYTRLKAIMALGQMKSHPDGALQVIKDALSDPDRDVRKGACHALEGFEEAAASAFSCLSELTRESDHDTRRDAISAMTRLKVEPELALPFYTPLLNGEDTTFSYFAAIGLLHQGEKAAPSLDELVRALDNRRSERTFVINTLGKIGPEAGAAVGKLCTLFDSLGDEERERAVDALGEIGSPDAIPVLEQAAANDRQKRVRDHSAWALKKIRQKEEGPEAQAPCREFDAAEEKFNCLKDLFDQGNAGKQHMAMAEIVQVRVGPELAVPFFAPLLDNEDMAISYFAAIGLHQQGTGAAPAVEDLVRALDRDQRERIIIIQALGRIGPGASVAVDKLIDLLKQGRDEERQNAANALGLIGSPDAIPALEEAFFRDEQHGVRTHAQWALGKIRTSMKFNRQ